MLLMDCLPKLQLILLPAELLLGQPELLLSQMEMEWLETLP